MRTLPYFTSKYFYISRERFQSLPRRRAVEWDRIIRPFRVLLVTALLLLIPACRDDRLGAESDPGAGVVVASDTILSEMVRSLLPPEFVEVTAILPPDQCPGHYDLKLSDIEKVERADLVVCFRDSPFMENAKEHLPAHIFLDRGGRNWMAPDSYIFGLNLLAGELAGHFPKHKATIVSRLEKVSRQVEETAAILREEVRRAGIEGRSVIASSMQQEPLEWMGLQVPGVYGRPESISVKDVVRLSELGRQTGAVLVVDNLQSGPEAGWGIAEALNMPHVVLSNFPSDKGYLSTLRANVSAVVNACGKK